jgi:hypothetical protein
MIDEVRGSTSEVGGEWNACFPLRVLRGRERGVQAVTPHMLSLSATFSPEMRNRPQRRAKW